MAVLKKEDFLAKIKARVGDDTSDEAMAFIEDMTDTFNDLETKTNDKEDWKKKYEDNDKEWREKYKARFFEATDSSNNGGAIDNPPTDDKDSSEEITYDDLFTESEV